MNIQRNGGKSLAGASKLTHLNLPFDNPTNFPTSTSTALETLPRL